MTDAKAKEEAELARGRSSVGEVEAEEYEPEWRFTQWFRKMPNENDDNNLDFLSTVEFSQDGSYLATGDMGGRVVVLATDKSKTEDVEFGPPVHYKFHCEFPSHEPEFDYVRSQQVSEKINQIKWLPPSNNSLYMLVTNDKEIKLWKIYETEEEDIVAWNFGRPPASRMSRARGAAASKGLQFNRNNLRLPAVEKALPRDGEGAFIGHKLRRSFARDVHQFPIASLAVSPDGDHFLSGDHLRINLWNTHVTDKAFNVVDLKPADMQDLSEVMNVVDYHPIHSNLFLYGTSRANIRLCDMRQRALCDVEAKNFGPGRPRHDQVDPNKGFFNELTQAITDAKFSKGGRFIISRDFMSIKIWDINQEKRPVETIYVHEYLRPSPAMWHLYERELLFDPFTLGISADGDIVTGSYNSFFHIYNLGQKTDTFFEAANPGPAGELESYSVCGLLVALPIRGIYF